MTLQHSSTSPNLGGYRPGQYPHEAGIFKRLIWYAVNSLLFHSWLFPFYSAKAVILRAFGARIGSGFVIKPRVNIKFPWRLICGNNVWVGEGVWLDNLGTISIGSNVCISQGAMLLTGNHDYKDPQFSLQVQGICLEDGVWIGARAIVCPGVTCKRDSVVSVGSVLTSETESNGIYAGNPATRVRERNIRVPCE